MKAVSVILLSLVAYSQAGVILNSIPAVAVAETGISEQTRAQDNLGNYAFSYDEGHTSGGTFRKEVGNSLGNKAGSYGLRDIDGRVRVVNYVADAAGFRVNIKTNEPGVDASQDPADTLINKDIVAVQAATPIATAYSAPILHHAINTPLLHAAPLGFNGFTFNTAIAHHSGVAGVPSYSVIRAF